MSNVIDALVAALGSKIRTGADIPSRNHTDASGLQPAIPQALILPQTTEDVSTALRLCHQHRQAVVTQGGLTGLAGGAHPQTGEIALSLERMNGVEEIDTASATLTALAGTPLAVVQQAADEAGFLCGIDLGARGTCTIGGNIATNAGGNQVVRYGMARRNTLGLEVVLADGTVVRSLNKMLKNNAGYDWTQLFIGSEGTLGVITRAVIGLHSKPQGLQTALCAVSSFEDALVVLRRFQQAHPGRLLVFEAMWREFMTVATKICGLAPAFEAEHDVTLLIEADMGADPAGTEAFSLLLSEFYEQDLIKDAVVAQSRADRNRFWAYRETPYEYGRFLPEEIRFDVSVPLNRMTEAVAHLRQEMPKQWPDAVYVVFGHVADSNIHINVAIRDMNDGIKKGVQGLVYDLVARLGGSISAEHGIGRIKRPYLSLSRTEPELVLMRKMKQTLDPEGILNPGRIL
ncbi:FAD-binding oxidoreductase [Microvirga tunisiensis]|jgi:FAD/FMN-containing dehydrogenase|uniref:FAD-binding oxidoreductase n=1 Tax=Microvirga tunisiensis TaxID=2108360 RepID=A0A5N7MB60_9HYPH|nr:FAD-binding oxidoreductase [Microvirga tunisiensis]MPR05728.1 FAD-binding oxidoreductase [Microvirga tunisiensis]MPR23928.1 FAD-binding oxidoreductase [Microvirga tunisiensis]